MSNLDLDQRALRDRMPALSETAYCAGWMQDLEHALWRAVVEGPRRYGRLEINEGEIAELKRLSAACGGWIAWGEEPEEVWLPMAAWLSRYDPNKAR